MAIETVIYKFQGDSQDLDKVLDKLSSGMREVEKSSKGTEKGLKGFERQSKRTKKDVDRLDRSLDGVEATTRIFGGTLGEAGGILGDVRAAAQGFGSALTGSSGMVAALGAAALGVAGLAAGLGALTAGLVALNQRALESIENLDELGVSVGQEQRDQIEKTSAAFDGLKASLDLLIVELAELAGPITRDLLTALTNIIGSLRDFIGWIDNITQPLRTLRSLMIESTGVTRVFIAALTGGASEVLRFASSLTEASDETDRLQSSALKTTDSIDSIKQSATSASTSVQDLVESFASSESISGKQTVFSRLKDQADAFSEALDEIEEKRDRIMRELPRVRGSGGTLEGVRTLTGVTEDEIRALEEELSARTGLKITPFRGINQIISELQGFDSPIVLTEDLRAQLERLKELRRQQGELAEQEAELTADKEQRELIEGRLEGLLRDQRAEADRLRSIEERRLSVELVLDDLYESQLELEIERKALEETRSKDRVTALEKEIGFEQRELELLKENDGSQAAILKKEDKIAELKHQQRMELIKQRDLSREIAQLIEQIREGTEAISFEQPVFGARGFAPAAPEGFDPSALQGRSFDSGFEAMGSDDLPQLDQDSTDAIIDKQDDFRDTLNLIQQINSQVQRLISSISELMQSNIDFLMEAFTMATDRLRELQDEQDDLLDAHREQSTELHKVLLEMDEEEAAAARDNIERQQRMEEKAAEASVRRAQRVRREKQEAAQKAITQQFRLEQAASITESIINTAVGITQVIAQTGVGAPLIIPAIAALGAAQTAAIAAQSPPVVRHGGGPIGDEVPMTGRRGEYVVQAGSAMKNRQALEELNRTGEMPGRHTNVYIGTSQIEPELVELASGEGEFSKLIRDKSPGIKPL